jgi:hypothetical protein
MSPRLIGLVGGLVLVVGWHAACSHPSNADILLSRLQVALQAAPNDKAYQLAHEAMMLTQTLGPLAPPVLREWVRALEQTIAFGADPTITALIVDYLHALIDEGANQAIVRTWLASQESRPYLEQLPPHLQEILLGIVQPPHLSQRIRP